MIGSVRTSNIASKVRSVLRCDTWQVASIISCQVHIAPDALARTSARKGKGRSGNDPSGVIVRRCLHSLYMSGQVERRKSETGCFEYRLVSGWVRSNQSYETRIKKDAYESGYVKKADYPRRKSFIDVTQKMVESGILILEPGGDFILNPEMQTENKSNECS